MSKDRKIKGEIKMRIGNYEVIFMSKVSGVVAESPRELLRIIWVDRMATGYKPFRNLNWEVRSAKI